MKNKYKVQVQIDYFRFDEIYKTEILEKETLAVSEKKAINNVRYNLIGNKYNNVDCGFDIVKRYDFKIIEEV